MFVVLAFSEVNRKVKINLVNFLAEVNKLRIIVPTFDTKVTEYLRSGWFFFLQTNFDFLTSHFWRNFFYHSKDRDSSELPMDVTSVSDATTTTISYHEVAMPSKTTLPVWTAAWLKDRGEEKFLQSRSRYHLPCRPPTKQATAEELITGLTKIKLKTTTL